MSKSVPATSIPNAAFAQALAEMDKADISAIELTLVPIPVQDVKIRIDSAKGKFFAVDFARKNDKKEKGVIVEAKGSIRHMVCRRGVTAFVEGTSTRDRASEDEAHDVLTVWDVQTFHDLRKRGKTRVDSGKGSYRRINLADVKAISIPKIEVAEETEALVEA